MRLVMPVNITESAITAALKRAKETGRRLELIDSAQSSLRIRISPSGSKSWSLSCRDQKGVMRRYPVGPHPQLGVSAARIEARKLIVKIKIDGADPIAERKRNRHSSEGSITLTTLLNVYERDGATGRKSWPDAKRRISSVFKQVINQSLTQITRSELQIIADTYPAKMSASAAVRYLRPILKWGSKRGYVGEDLARIEPPAKVQRRTRVVNSSELRQILPAIKKSDRPQWQVFHFILLTLVRREEAASATWGDIDWDNRTWNLEKNKTDNAILIPLSDQAIQLLKIKWKHGASAEDLVFASKNGKRLSNWDRETKLLFKKTSTSGWHRHDLRRTGATTLGDLGEIPDYIEAALNHKNIHSALAANYNRSRYLPEVRRALQRLADYYDKLVAEQETAENRVTIESFMV
jgi:integrase